MDEEDKHCLLWRVTKSPLACWHNTSLLAGRFCKSPLCPIPPARRTIMHCHAATLHKAYPLKLVDENLESGSMAGKAGHAWQSCFATHCMQSQRWQQRVAREEKRVLDQHNHDSILASSVSFSHWMTFVISSKPCSITRRLHCTCTQRCLRHCLLPCPSNLPKCFVAGKWYSQEQRTSRYREDIERNTCYRTTFLILWIADGKEVVKKFIDDSPQSTNTSAFLNTFCRCRTGLSTILPCRCHPRHSHPRHVGTRWCVDGLHGVTIY